MRRVVVLVVVSIGIAGAGVGAGCKGDSGKPEGTAAAYADCNVVPAAIERLAQNVTDPVAKERTPRLKDAMRARCEADKWSKEALQCIADAKDRAHMELCESKLTKEQQDQAKQASRAVLGDVGGGDSAGGGSAGVGSGSAEAGSGSAGSGSAEAGSGSAAGAAAGSGAAGGATK